LKVKQVLDTEEQQSYDTLLHMARMTLNTQIAALVKNHTLLSVG
jgi:hypothetical protein